MDFSLVFVDFAMGGDLNLIWYLLNLTQEMGTVGGGIMYSIGFVSAIIIAVGIWLFMRYRAKKQVEPDYRNEYGNFKPATKVIGSYMSVSGDQGVETRPLVWPA